LEKGAIKIDKNENTLFIIFNNQINVNGINNGEIGVAERFTSTKAG
jgi:hypothetical protein